MVAARGDFGERGVDLGARRLVPISDSVVVVVPCRASMRSAVVCGSVMVVVLDVAMVVDRVVLLSAGCAQATANITAASITEDRP